MITDNETPIRSSLPAPSMQPTLVAQALRDAAADPDKLAIVDGATGMRLSRADFAQQSAALAAGLEGRGIGRGDVVALAMPNICWWPVVALGVWRAGAALATLNPTWTAAEMGRVLTVVRPRLGIAHGPVAESLEAGLMAAGLDVEVVVQGEPANATPLERLLASAEDPFAEASLEPDDLAIVPFSSGLGGLPKGVRLTHRNLSAVSAQVVMSHDYHSASVVLAGAPVFNAMGLVASLCTPLSVGSAIVTIPRPTTDRSLELISEHRVTHATLPPTVVAEMAANPEVERYDTTCLELVVTGGDDVPAALQLRASERLGALVRQAYGMTEALAISATLVDRPSDPETVGWLAAGTEARVVDPEYGHDVGPGKPGELWIRGPQVMDGYFDDPDATAAMITADGWLRTGDLVRIRDDGQLVIEDRLKELIKVKGASVAPAELEFVLREHPSVDDVCVVGRPDAKRGEVPVGWVALSGPASEEELISFVRSRVANHKRLHDVRIVDQLPRGPNGELLRRALRDAEVGDGRENSK
jgi:acyl-CoA synthetase (AMP-forming)/AMP-acid ligase II